MLVIKNKESSNYVGPNIFVKKWIKPDYASNSSSLLYCHLLIHAEIYIYIYIYILDTYRRNEQQTQWQRRRTTSLTKYLPITLLQGFEKVVCGFTVTGSWRPNITEIFWLQSYVRQPCVFLVLQGCSTGALESTLLSAGFPYYILSATSRVPKLHRGSQGPPRPGVAFPTTSRLYPLQLNCLDFCLDWAI